MMDKWRFYMIKTVFLIIIWLTMGLYEAIFGPALMDLKSVFGASYSSISWAVGSRGIGIPVGGVIGGLLADKFPKWLDTMLALSTVLTAVTIAWAPYSGNINVFWLMCFLNGFGLCTTNIAGQRLLLLMWKKKAASPTHAMHGGYGIGAFLIPLVVNPFLAEIPAGNDILNNTNSSLVNKGVRFLTNVTQTNLTLDKIPVQIFTHFNQLNMTESDVDVGIQKTRVHIAFLIVGALTLVSALPFFVYQCITNTEYQKVCHMEKQKNSGSARNLATSRPLREILNPATYTDGALCYGIGMFLLLLVYYISVNGGEQGFGLFIRSFSIDSLEFSKDDASYLNMVYWIGFTVARALATVIARFVHIKYLISVEATFLLISVTILDLIGAKTPKILWIFTVLQGLLIGPLFPTGIAYANSVMDVSGICLMVVFLSSGLGTFLYSWLAGVVYDIIGPRALLYALQASGCSVFVTVCLLRLISYRRESRYATRNTVAGREESDIEEANSLANIDTSLQDNNQP